MSGNQTDNVGLPAGSKVGKYEILQRLAIGGQGIVYKARDPMLARDVAIKQMSAHLVADATFLERFQREAQILAKLGSEQSAVVTVLDMIQDERGLFMVMEFVAGHTLEDSLRDNPGPVETKAVLAILWRLAAGLHAVHQAGVIHRDLKPANIIIGTGLRCKIMDFGVAATSDGQTSMVLGTTKYMAPELYEHKSVDARADLYSLGFIMYEMLLGREKFNEQFADIVRDKHSEHLRWMKWHGNESQTATPLHELNPELPRAISDIVAKMMAKRPEDRYANMEDLGKAVKSAFSPKASSGSSGKRRSSRKRSKSAAAGAAASGSSAAFADEPLLTAPLPKKSLSLKTLLLIAGAVSVCLVTGLVALMMVARQGDEKAAQQVQVAFDEAKSLYDRKQYAQAMRGFSDLAKQHGGSRIGAHATVMAYLAQAQDAVSQAEGVSDAAARGPHWDTAANAMDNADKASRAAQGNYPKQEWVAKLGDEIKSQRSSYLVRQRFQEAVDKADAKRAEKKYKEAADLLMYVPETGIPERQTLLQRLRRQIAQEQLEDQYAASLVVVSKARAAGNFAEAMRELTTNTAKLVTEDRVGAVGAERLAAMQAEVEKLQETLKTTGAYSQAVARADQKLQSGATYQDKQDALRSLKDALTLLPSDELRQRIDTLEAEVMCDLGMAYAAKGEVEEAREAFEQSLAIRSSDAARRELAKLNNDVTLTTLLDEAENALDAGTFEEALMKFEAALEVAKSDPRKAKEVEAIRSGIAESKFELKLASARALMEQRKYEEAKTALEEARRLLPDQTDRADELQGLMTTRQGYEKYVASAKDLLKRKDFDRAREEAVKAQKLLDTPDVQDVIKQILYERFMALGQAAMDQTRYRDAFANFNQAKDSRDTDEIRALIRQAEEKMK